MEGAQLPTYVLDDPTVDFSEKTVKVARLGHGYRTWTSYAFTPRNPTLNSSCTVNIPIPATQGLDRNPMFEFFGTLTLPVAVANAKTAAGPNAFGFSGGSIYNMISSMQLDLGGAKIQQTNINRYSDLLRRITHKTATCWNLYGSAALTDFSTSFDVTQNTYSSAINGSANTPIAFKESPRTTMFNVTANPANADGDLIVDFYIIAPILMPPFIQSGDQEKAFLRANVLRLTVNFQSATGFELFSCCQNLNAAGCTPNGVGTIDTDTSQFNLLYSTVDIQNVPRALELQCYDSYDIVYYPQSGPAFGANATVQANLNQIVFPRQPSLIIVACRDPTTVGNFNKPPSYLVPVGCNVNYLNGNRIVLQQAACVGNCGPSAVANVMPNKRLHEIAVKNGLSMNFAQFSGVSTAVGIGNIAAVLSGGYVVLAPEDLVSSLSLSDAPGSGGTTGSFSFSGQFTFANQTGAAINVTEIVVLTISPQILEETSPGAYQQNNIRYDQGEIIHLQDPLDAVIDKEDFQGSALRRHIGSKMRGQSKHGGKLLSEEEMADTVLENTKKIASLKDRLKARHA